MDDVLGDNNLDRRDIFGDAGPIFNRRVQRAAAPGTIFQGVFHRLVDSLRRHAPRSGMAVFAPRLLLAPLRRRLLVRGDHRRWRGRRRRVLAEQFFQFGVLLSKKAVFPFEPPDALLLFSNDIEGLFTLLVRDHFRLLFSRPQLHDANVSISMRKCLVFVLRNSAPLHVQFSWRNCSWLKCYDKSYLLRL